MTIKIPLGYADKLAGIGVGGRGPDDSAFYEHDLVNGIYIETVNWREQGGYWICTYRGYLDVRKYRLLEIRRQQGEGEGERE